MSRKKTEGARKPRSGGPLFNHDVREMLVRVCIQGLLNDASMRNIHRACEEQATKEMERPIKINRRTIETYCAQARTRMVGDYKEDLSEHAMEQLLLLKEIQRRSLKGGTHADHGQAIRASRAISRILGLDQPKEMRHFVEEGERLKETVLAAMKAGKLTPEQMKAVAAALTKDSKTAPKVVPLAEPADDDDWDEADADEEEV